MANVVFVTGGTGVLGRVTLPALAEAGYDAVAPGSRELDLFDEQAVAEAVAGATAVMHLATRIPPAERFESPGAWDENDRLRTEGARFLVDAALAHGVETYVQPTIALLYPEGRVDESTPLTDVPQPMRSALVAEDETARFAAAGRRGVALRLGLLYGPGTGNDGPVDVYGATLHVDDAATALMTALTAPSGLYNVVNDGERVSAACFKNATGWRAQR